MPRRTECDFGHPWTEDNTMINGSRRSCHTCQEDRDKKKALQPKKSRTLEQREWRNNNREHVLARQKRYRKDHPEHKRESAKIYLKKYRVQNKERIYRRDRNRRLIAKYGIPIEKYEILFNEQGGVCFICHQPETRVVKGAAPQLVVDHDHRTGEIRKLLCHKCNVAIGLFDESPDRLRQAANYLVNYKKVG